MYSKKETSEYQHILIQIEGSIGIDLGTPAVKFLILDGNGAIHNVVSRDYPISFLSRLVGVGPVGLVVCRPKRHQRTDCRL